MQILYFNEFVFMSVIDLQELIEAVLLVLFDERFILRVC